MSVYNLIRSQGQLWTIIVLAHAQQDFAVWGTIVLKFISFLSIYIRSILPFCVPMK